MALLQGRFVARAYKRLDFFLHIKTNTNTETIHFIDRTHIHALTNRDSNPGPPGWDSDVLSTMPGRRLHSDFDIIIKRLHSAFDIFFKRHKIHLLY